MSTAPLAYLITFRCYGTWLHGDARGSVDRRHNEYNTPLLPADPQLEQRQREAMKHPPVTLSVQQREAIARAIKETCTIRQWELHALAVRSNHVHVVLTAESKAENMLNALKANATSCLRAAGLGPEDRTPWSTGGSTRYLWNRDDLRKAIHYVTECQ